jgi:hypothetical protein
MAGRLLGLLLTLASWAAFAQKAAEEAPSPQASPVAVIIFLVLFIGACVAYFVYIWVRRKKDTTPPDA